MARITIEITDAIQVAVVNKIKAIGDAATASQTAIEQLNISLNSLNNSGFNKAIKSQKDLTFAMEKSHVQAIEMDAKRKLSMDKLHTQALDMENKRKASIEKTQSIAIDMENKRKTISEKNHALAIDMENKRKSAIEKSQVIAIDMENKKNLAMQKSHVLALDMENKRRIAMEKSHAQAIQMNEAFDKKNSFGNLFTLNNLARAFVAIQLVERISKTVDAYTLMENKLKLVSSSMENTNFLQNEMFKISNETRAPVAELTASFVRFDYALKGLGATQRESLRFTKTLAEQLAISGLTTTEQSSALLQLSQALNKGKLDGDEFRTVMETLPTVATAIAKTMGVARGELIKLAPQGKITSAVIREAMASIAEETDKAFKNLTPTIGQAFTVMQNKIIENIGIFNKATGASEIFAKTLLVLAENIGTLTLAATLSATIFATRFVPSIVTGLAAINSAGIKLLLNPIFAIPALLAGAYIAIKSVLDRRNALIDDQTDKDNARADAFDKQQEKRRKAIIYETEQTIKLKEEYGKYLVLLAETKGAKEKGFISSRAEEALLIETVVGKGRAKAQELINKKPQALLLDSEILAKEVKDIKAEFDKSLVDLENYIRASVALRNEQTKKENQARKNLELSEQTVLTQRNKLLGLELFPIKTAFIDYTAKPIADLKEQIKLNEELRNERQLVFNAEFKTGELTSEVLRNQLELEAELKKSLEERIGLIARIGVETIKADVINTRDRLQKQYNDTLAATNELVREGNINEARQQILLSETNKAKELLRTTQKADAFIYKTDTEKRLEAINLETIETLRLVDANVKLFASYKDYADKRAQVEEGSKKQKEELKKETIRGSLVASGGSITNVRIDEINKEEKRYKDYKLSITALEKDEINQKNLKYAEINEINAKFRKQEIEAEREHKEKLRMIDYDAASKTLSVYAGMFGALAGLSDKFAKGKGKDAERAFKITKALAYAEATATTASAIAKANDHPFPYNIPLIVAAAATGAAQIATIKQTEFQGYAKGAIDIGGTGTSTSDSMLAYIGRHESVINGNSTKRHKNLLEAINADNGTSSSINNTYVGSNNKSNAPTINIINNTGSEIKQTGNYNPETNTMEVMLEQVETRLAQKYADGNGKLAKAIDGKRLRNY